MSTPHNIPTPSFANLFVADPLADRLWRRWIGEDRYPIVRGHLYRLGHSGAEAGELAAIADRNPPTLRTHDLRGEPCSQVDYHPAYRRLEELSYGAEIVSLKYNKDFLAAHREVRHLVGFGGGYYFAQSEAGLYCPICMTDGVAWVLERVAADAPIARRTIERLCARDPATLWRGAMFLTERVGGSDVGANSVEAHQDGDRWRLRGHKWFCSNVDAEAILVLARMPGGGPGTRGLGLFLLLREEPAGNAGKIRIERLKDKFGTRSMATGEVTLLDAEATLIAGVGQGFKAMAEMINLSRTYNAVASLAGIRRAILEALAYGAERRAFGARLWELPLWRATMADLVAEHLASWVTIFALVRALDRAEGGDEGASRLVRALTPICKAVTAKQAVWAVSEAMEAIGANAYVEWSPLPRLLRDAQVLPIWEGTTNILSLDLLRAIARERAHEALFARIEAAIADARERAPELAELVAGRRSAATQAMAAAATLGPEDQQRASRGLVEALWRAFSLAILLEESTAAAAEGDDEAQAATSAAIRRIAARPFVTAPAGSCAGSGLSDTEEVLLRAGFTPRG